ncbi:hypothetical protein KI387_038389, partial [Taxus chinensis]
GEPGGETRVTPGLVGRDGRPISGFHFKSLPPPHGDQIGLHPRRHGNATCHSRIGTGKMDGWGVAEDLDFLGLKAQGKNFTAFPDEGRKGATC